MRRRGGGSSRAMFRSSIAFRKPTFSIVDGMARAADTNMAGRIDAAAFAAAIGRVIS
jgi:hypothetical protein